MKKISKLALFSMFSISFLVLNLNGTGYAFSMVKAQGEYSIDLTGYTWDHYTISVSITPKQNESWWNPSYLNATLRAIAQWNEAISDYGSNYTNFSYISKIRFDPKITYEQNSDFDIYISWISECKDETKIGESQATIESPCVFSTNTVCLAARSPSGHVMTEVDMQNIVVHELGHTLGLSHSNYSGDVMYYKVSYGNSVKRLSSLDLYGLCTIFEGISNSNMSKSSYVCPAESSVALPSDMRYYYLQISNENLPITSPENFSDKIIALLFRPETQSIILGAFILLALMTTILILQRRKHETRLKKV